MPPEPLAGGRGFFENLDRSLFTAVVTAATLALAAYFWFNFWTTHRTTRELLKVAQRSPEQLFPHSPEAGMAQRVFGREQLVGEIADSLLSPGAGPQILIGGTGSGKTTVLLAVASHLATEHHIVPIVFSLRDESNDLTEKENDFTKLAEKRFKELIDPYVKSEAEAEKVWRWLCKQGQIVILTDDLDRSAQVNHEDSYRTWVRLALDKARRRGLPLVVTTRPSGMPPDLSELPINLSDYPLEGEADAAEYVLGRAGCSGDRDRDVVERNIEKGDLIENAFYLDLLIRLLRIGTLEKPREGGRHAVRLQLLEGERKRLCGEGILDKTEWQRRDEALCGIEDLAAAWLVPTSESGFDQQRWQGAVRNGERFGLLALDDRRHPQFKHEVLHAYYASRAIARRRATWKDKLDQRPSGARVQLALVLTAAGDGDEEFCRQACDRLLDDVAGLNADQRLLRAAAAAELAKAGPFSGADSKIAQACLRAKSEAGPVAKRAALEQLETVGGTRAVEALWEFAHDDDYGTRWDAVKRLVRRCSAGTSRSGEEIRPPVEAGAYKVIEPEIETALKNAAPLLEEPEDKPIDDWNREIVLLKQLAWMLPSLRTAANDPETRGRIETHLQELLRLEREATSPQYGLEASIAQGFKAEAGLFPNASLGPGTEDAEEMLGRARFWYSQLNLIHALALRMAKDPSHSAASLRKTVITIQQCERERKRGWKDGAAVFADLHPMVRYAARLCEDALADKAAERRLERVERVVWEDEGVVVSRRPRDLDPAAAQLVGEITVLLNLNETGSLEQRREFAEKVTLPHCLQGSRRRHELQDGCPGDCDFRLCPFHPVRDQPSAHREISRAFCRDQGRHAHVRTARGWGARVTRRSLPEFWRWLEAQARY
jgi:hypothetical protein